MHLHPVSHHPRPCAVDPEVDPEVCPAIRGHDQEVAESMVHPSADRADDRYRLHAGIQRRGQGQFKVGLVLVHRVALHGLCLMRRPRRG